MRDRSTVEPKKVWKTPRVTEMKAGSAEANGTKNVDGGPVGNAVSS